MSSSKILSGGSGNEEAAGKTDGTILKGRGKTCIVSETVELPPNLQGRGFGGFLNGYVEFEDGVSRDTEGGGGGGGHRKNSPSDLREGKSEDLGRVPLQSLIK